MQGFILLKGASMNSLPPFSFSIHYNTILITGTVQHCSISDVTVEITSPYESYKVNLHTQYNSLYLCNRNLDVNNKLSDKGVRTITTALTMAYTDADFLYKHRNVFYPLITDYEKSIQSKITTLKEFEDKFVANRKAQKILLKQKVIKDIVYADFLKYNRDHITLLKDEIKNCKRDIFSGYPEFVLKYDSEDICIEFVKKYYVKELFPDTIILSEKIYYDPYMNGTEVYWTSMFGFNYTDSVKYFAQIYNAYWTIDLIGSYLPKLKALDFLVIYFDVENNQCNFYVKEDADTPDIVSQFIYYTDLTVSIKLYLTNSVLMFPSDY